jgi:type II secretory pathway pseudopilin PulG
MRQSAAGRKPGGFTIIELLIILVIVGLIAVLGFPALHRAIQRMRHEGFAREAAALARAARLQAIRNSTATYVEVDLTNRVLRSILETDGVAGPTDDDRVLRTLEVPGTVYFWGPGDAGPNGPAAIDGFGGQSWATFTARGAALDSGAFRLGDSAGRNFLEVRVDPPATARISLLRWDGSTWRAQGEGGVSWKWN